MEDEDRLAIWLSRNITRNDAEKALQGQRDGVFLVRASVSAPGDYVISVVFGGAVQHHQIKHYKGRMVTQSGRELNSLAELIRHYKTQADGLSAPLTSGCTIYDPPRAAGPKPPVPRRDPSGSVSTAAGAPLIPPRRSTSSSSGLDADLVRYEIAASRVSFINAVGSGRFGQVFEAWLAPEGGASSGTDRGKLVAVKTCKQGGDEHSAKTFLREAGILQQFSHPNVLALIGVVTAQDPLLLVLEYVAYGDLRAVLKSCRVKSVAVTPREKLWMATQIAAGMDHLVSRKCIHRDLAARNVLLGHYCSCKIADFGLSRQLEEDSDYYRAVSHSILPIKWMAPECLDGRVFTTANDIWSFGVVLWEIMGLAKTPFKRETTAQVTRKIKDGERLPQPKDCPDNVYALMRLTWNAEPKLRPPFSDLHQRLVALHTSTGDAPPRDIGALAQDKPGSAAPPPRQSWEFPRDELRYIKDLGEGEFGRVVLMSVSSSSESVSQKMVAVKILADEATAEAAAAFEKEMQMLMTLNFQHRNVVTLLGVSVTEEPHMLVMEYMNLGDLQGMLRDAAPGPGKPPGLSVDDFVGMAAQIAAGCSYLASRDFVHRDIAARNCLVGTGNIVKIADFGLGRTLEHSDYYKTQGGVLPLRWMAPETVLYGKFSSMSDVWAFGVVMWEIFAFGAQPLHHLTNIQIISALSGNNPPIHKMPPECPAPLCELVRQCHATAPDARPTFLALESALQRILGELTAGEGQHIYEAEPDTLSEAGDVSSPARVIVKQGWLIKQGGGSTPFGRTNWKRRWFVLNSDGKLLYRKTGRPKESPLGMFQMQTAKCVRSEPAFESSFDEGCCFSITTPDRTYCLVGDIAEEAAEWLRALGQFVKS